MRKRDLAFLKTRRLTFCRLLELYAILLVYSSLIVSPPFTGNAAVIHHWVLPWNVNETPLGTGELLHTDVRNDFDAKEKHSYSGFNRIRRQILGTGTKWLSRSAGLLAILEGHLNYDAGNCKFSDLGGCVGQPFSVIFMSHVASSGAISLQPMRHVAIRKASTPQQ